MPMPPPPSRAPTDTSSISRVTLVSVDLLEVPIGLSMVQRTCNGNNTRLSMAAGKTLCQDGQR